MVTPILILVIIAFFSLTAVRVGAQALMMTGLGADSANFQAYSAFFGVGFTTSEAELVVNHPVRRRIIRDLILVGNLGLMSGAATVVVSFVEAEQTIDILEMLGIILLLAVVFRMLGRVNFLHRAFDGLIRHTLERAGLVRALDYEMLLRVRDGYCVSEVELLEDNPLAGKSLGASRPADFGLIVLGIQKNGGGYIGAPGPKDVLEVGDVIMIYGREDAVCCAAEGKQAGEKNGEPGQETAAVPGSPVEMPATEPVPGK